MHYQALTMKTAKIKVRQLSTKLKTFKSIEATTLPEIGWVKTIRTGLGISLEQLGDKLEITKQSAQNLEKREALGSATINAMKEAGQAMDMKFVYGYIPVDGTLEALIEKKAKKLATEIVMRTSATMRLENQENSPQRIKDAIEERTKELIDEMPKILWD